MSPEGAAPPVESRYEFAYGKGKLPWILAILWFGFLAWFVWFAFVHQLPNFRSSFPTATPAPGAPASARPPR